MPIDQPKHPGWMVGILVVAGAIALLVGHWALDVDTSPIGDLTAHYEIPPTFGHNRPLYGGVLALMLTMTLLGFGAFIENVRFLTMHKSSWREPAKVEVVNESLLLFAVLLAIVPDVLVLVSWGELMAPPYALLSKWDRAFDGISALFFIAYIIRRLRARPTLLFMLQMQRDIPVALEPTWEQLRPKLLVILAVVVISFGVAFAK